MHSADAFDEACRLAGVCEVVTVLIGRCVCLVPAAAAELEAALRDSHILQHTGRLQVLLRSAGDRYGAPYVSRWFPIGCVHLACRMGDAGASRQLLGGWPLMTLLAQSVAALQALDGGTAYGLPEELRMGVAQLGQMASESGSTVELWDDLETAACALAHGPAPLPGVSRRGALAVMLRTGRLALSAVAGGGRAITPRGHSDARGADSARSLAVHAVDASTRLLLSANPAAGWVRDGGAAVWRLAADVLSADAVLSYCPYPGFKPAKSLTC